MLVVPLVAFAQTLAPPVDRPYEPPTVRLLSAGAAPRAALRYALRRTEDATIVASGEWKMATPAGSSTSTFPVFTTPVHLTPVKGQVDFRWVAPSFTGPPPGSRLEQQSQQLMGGLDGSGGVYSADARGIISRFLLHPGPNDALVDAGTIQQRSLYALQMGREMISLLAVPLPEEPVGLGARWQIERVAVRGMMSFIQVTTFTLEARGPGTLEVSYRFGGKWDPGCGLAESELSLGVSGGGKATVDLAAPLPVALADEINVTAEIKGRQGQHGTQAGSVRTSMEAK
jgi:hypothetical protein